MDNLGAVYAINNGGSNNPDMCRLAKKIWTLCLAENISIGAVYTPGKSHAISDYLSRVRDEDSWQLNPATFKEVERRFGKMDWDIFADENNTQ